jgi:hypothetical protein
MIHRLLLIAPNEALPLSEGVAMKILGLFVVFLISFGAGAEEYGFVGEIDLDNDGIKDHIQSGPSSMFGNGGGPIVVTLSATVDSPSKSYVIAAYDRFAVEKFGADRPVRLWSYWHISSSEGIVTGFTFTKSEMTRQSLRIYTGGLGSQISHSIAASIFREENIFQLDRVNPYTVPPHPAGHEWGK